MNICELVESNGKENMIKEAIFEPDKSKPNGSYDGLPFVVTYFNIYDAPVRVRKCFIYCKFCDGTY